MSKKDLKEKLEHQWIAKFLSDSTDGSSMNMEPMKIKHKEPSTGGGWNKVKRIIAIETPSTSIWKRNGWSGRC